MSVSNRHVLRQGAVIGGLLRTIGAAVAQQVTGTKTAAPAVPGQILREKTPPRPSDLVDDYIEHVGGDKSAYRGTVPAHLFPQWAFALAGQTLVGIPYRNAEGRKIPPGAEHRFTVSAIPDDWPLDWHPGRFVFPEVYPQMPARKDCPPEQINLDAVLDFVLG